MLNEYADYNMRQKIEMEKKCSITNKRYWGYELAKVFQCVECGAWLPSTVIYYYHGQVYKVKCYACQKKDPNAHLRDEE